MKVIIEGNYKEITNLLAQIKEINQNDLSANQSKLPTFLPSANTSIKYVTSHQIASELSLLSAKRKEYL